MDETEIAARIAEMIILAMPAALGVWMIWILLGDQT